MTCKCAKIAGIIFGLSLLFADRAPAADDLIAHWKLARDGRDGTTGAHHAINHGVHFEDGSQVYSTAIYEGRIHAGTWPTGSVFRYEGPQQWINTGRLGNEQEVMGMAVYNGKLYAGTLPQAEIYRYDGQDNWVSTGQLDETLRVRYRRAWVTAVYNGKLFCGLLPSGHVRSLEAGKCVTYDRALPAGWHHIAAVKSKHRLKLSAIR